MYGVNSDRVEFANTLRGVAAVLVLVSHYCGVFWMAPGAVANFINANPLPVGSLPRPYLSELVSYLGPFGVALFFVISGFVIPFSLAKHSAGQFLFRRALRIYPTYIVGFSITLLAIYASTIISGRPWPHDVTSVFFHYIPGLRDVANVRMIDGIIWTLDVELKFYVVCAAIAPLFARKSIAVFLMPVALASVALAAFALLYANAARFDLTTVHYYRLAMSLIVSAQFICFMFIGTAVYFLHQRVVSPPVGTALALLMFALYAVIALYGPDRGGSRLVPVYALAAILFAAAYLLRAWFRPTALTDFFADISYPLYVVHGVAGYFVILYAMKGGAPPVVALVAASAAAISLAYLLHIYVERPTRNPWRIAAVIPSR